MSKLTYFFVFVLFLMLTFSWQVKANLNLAHDGKIKLYVYHLDDVLEVNYLDNNRKWDEEAYKKINHILRSRGDGAIINMDKRLIELADHLQDHFGADVIEVISGYRSPAFNKSLKDLGHNVANESLHTKGLAMDIHIDEIKESTIRDYLKSLKLGGVGYYGDRLMIHMDFGPVREWHSGEFRENTEIGIFNKKTSKKFRTDKLFYQLNDKQILLIGSGFIKLVLQKFKIGKWVNLNVIINPEEHKNILDLEQLLKTQELQNKYGKFRWRYETKDTWQNSNEFYVKKM